MKKMLLSICFIALFISCSKDTDPVQELTKLEMLTGGSSKSFYIYASNPNESCEKSEELQSDNSWIFFSDGKFEFDRGEITGDEDPEGCSDPINMVGTWEFFDNETGIRIFALYPTGKPELEDEFLLVEGEIEFLNENEFVIAAYDPEFEETFTATFRARD